MRERRKGGCAESAAASATVVQTKLPFYRNAVTLATHEAP